MDRKKRAYSPVEWGLLLLSVLLTAGVRLIFHACGPKEDGTFMMCHQAEQAVFAAGIVLCLLSILILVSRKPGIKALLSCTAVLTAAAVMLIPGTLIHLCMMPQMRCRVLMRPSVMVLGTLILAAGVLSAVKNLRKGKG